MAGALVVVSTPIGNLADLSPRAADALAAADLIACEDTRQTRKLLNHAGVQGARLMALHAHNEAAGAAKVVDRVAAGERVALVTDAGTPSISDPGQRVVAAVAAAGFAVEVVPGPSAAIAALVGSGLATDRFCFEGFLPRKGGERTRRLAAIADDARTTVIYEAPTRLAATLADLRERCGAARPAAVARELTKIHEEIARGTLDELAERWRTVAPKGECVIVVSGAPEPEPASDSAITSALAARVEAGEDRKSAVAGVAAALGVPRRRVYELSLARRPGGAP
jgi:16S rRNA (cytidine1402-2'-O)-methyltransferase